MESAEWAGSGFFAFGRVGQFTLRESDQAASG
jgi:hypothetical protein